MFLAVDGLRDCTKVEDGTDIFLNYEIGESPKKKKNVRKKTGPFMCIFTSSGTTAPLDMVYR